ASPRDGAGRERGRVLIDRFLPEYDEVEHHEVAVDAPADRTYQAIKDIDLARSPVVLALLFARGLPHLFTGAVKPKRRLTLDDIVESGFVVLAEEPGRELALGTAGRFGRRGGGAPRPDGGEFTSSDDPGFPRAVGNSLAPGRPGGGSTVITETRVASPAADARRNFGWYWRLI